MRRRISAVVILVLAMTVLVGCSKNAETEGEEQREETTEAAAGETSEAARLRGLSVGDTGAGMAVAPEITLKDVVYEWRTTPTKGVYAEVELANPHDTYQRARGYAFIVAGTSSFGEVRGVYPNDVRFDGEYPEDFSDGRRLLFRKTDELQILIPYAHAEGYYEWLRVLVYDADGRILIDQSYDIEGAGTPTGPKEPGKAFAL
jgi:hypothetical protein